MTEIRDQHVPVQTLSSREVFSGKVFGIQRDELVLNESGGGRYRRSSR